MGFGGVVEEVVGTKFLEQTAQCRLVVQVVHDHGQRGLRVEILKIHKKISLYNFQSALNSPIKIRKKSKIVLNFFGILPSHLICRAKVPKGRAGCHGVQLPGAAVKGTREGP